MPAGAPLKAILDVTARRGPLTLTNFYGRPWTSDGFRTSWRKLCAQAGIDGLPFMISGEQRSFGWLLPAQPRAANRNLH
jgi:hypothetical protein